MALKSSSLDADVLNNSKSPLTANRGLKTLMEDPVKFKIDTQEIHEKVPYVPINEFMDSENENDDSDVEEHTNLKNGHVNGINPKPITLQNVKTSHDSPDKTPQKQKQEVPKQNGKTASPSFSSPSTSNTNDNTTTAFDWPSKYKSHKTGPGLHNLGNTCFLNATLQALIHTPPLITALLLRKDHDGTNCRKADQKKFCMLCAMRTLLKKALDDPSSRPFSPNHIVQNLKLIAKHLRAGRQEDAHEFLRFTVDSMQQSTLAGKSQKVQQQKKESSLIHHIFGGKLRSRVTCLKCNNPSDTYDLFLDLSVDVAKAPSLRRALDRFVEQDHLTGSNKYRCEKCKKPCNAKKGFTIESAPKILTVHLKRFTATGKKINEHISYDEYINLGPYMSKGDARYRLYAVICHQGSGPHCGHYYSYVRAGDNSWSLMDDSSTQKLHDEKPFRTKYAYLLFYARVDKDSSALPLMKNGYHVPHTDGKNGTNGTNGVIDHHHNNNNDESDDLGEKVSRQNGANDNENKKKKKKKNKNKRISVTSSPNSSFSSSPSKNNSHHHHQKEVPNGHGHHDQNNKKRKLHSSMQSGPSPSSKRPAILR